MVILKGLEECFFIIYTMRHKNHNKLCRHAR